MLPCSKASAFQKYVVVRLDELVRFRHFLGLLEEVFNHLKVYLGDWTGEDGCSSPQRLHSK